MLESLDLNTILGVAVAALLTAGVAVAKRKASEAIANVKDAAQRRALDIAKNAAFTAVDYLMPVALRAKEIGLTAGLDGKLLSPDVEQLHNFARTQALKAAGAFATEAAQQVDTWITERVEQRKADIAAMVEAQKFAEDGNVSAMLLAATKVGRKL